ncbi:MAG: fibronectin type III domain-containing protein [Bacteroidales bacterium]|nr:fibronectin type III domain-containing protein [Bacteroidales bacterium]
MKRSLKKILLSALMFLPMLSQVKAQCTDTSAMCSITIEMQDGYGDGWDNSRIRIYQNNVLLDSATVSDGYFDTVQFLVCPGAVVLEWVAVGDYNSECSFRVLDVEGSVLYSAAENSLTDTPTSVLDTVTVGCPTCFRPYSLVSTASTATSVSLQWVDYTTANSAWQIAYGPIGFNPNDITSTGVGSLSDVLSTTSTTISGLSNNIVYDFYVRTICSSADNSGWRGPVSVHPGSYLMPVSGNDTITACNLTIYDDGGVMGDYSNACDGSLTIFPSVANSLVTVSGTLVSQSNDQITIYNGVNTSAPVLATIQGNGNTPVVIPQIMSTTGPLTIKFYSNWNTVYSGFELTTSCVDMPTCAPIASIDVVNVVGASAMVEWSHMEGLGSEPLEYMVEIKDSITNTVLESTSVIGNRYLFTGLNETTVYSVRVRSVCGNDYGSWDSVYFKTPCLSGGSMELLSGTSSTANFPIFATRYYSYTQQIYEASELISTPAQINAISVEYQTTDVVNIPQNRNINIYLGHTTRSSFASTSDNVTLDSLHLVYSGIYTFQPGWNTIALDSVFNYNGSNNLVVAFDDNTGSSQGAISFSAVNNATNKSVYYASNTSNPDPASSMQAFDGDKYVRSFRMNVVFTAPCNTNVSCVAPAVYVDEVVENTISVMWAPGNTESAWDVEIRQSSETDWVMEATNISQTSYTFTDLDYNTEYEIRITSVCGSNRASSIVSAVTPCSAISSLPFAETFDSWTAGNNVSLDRCWAKLSNYVSASFAYPCVSTNQSSSASNSILFYATTTTYSALVFPAFEEDLSSLQVSFSMLKTTGSQNNIKLGVLADPQDISTFVTVDSVDVSVNNTWENFTISLENYQGQGGYIALLLPQTQLGTANRFVDNVIVAAMTQCRGVEGVVVSNVGGTSAVVSWTDNTQSSFVVEYGLNGFAVGSGSFDTTNTASLTLHGLQAQTAYDVYVYRLCDGGELSIPSSVVSFTTTCAEVVNLPFTETFDTWSTGVSAAIPQCWNRLSGSTSIQYVYASPSQSLSSPNSLYMKGTNSKFSAIILPKFATAIDSLKIAFDVKRTNGPVQHALHVGVITNVADINTFQPLDTIIPTQNNVWQSVEALLDNYQGVGGYIAIKLPPGMYPEYYIDNLEVDLIPLCVAPTDVVSASNVSEALVVDWTEAGTATQWEICYGPDGFNPYSGQGNIITGISSHPYTIQNLSNDTTYNVYVRAICGAGDTSSWSVDYLDLRPGVYYMPTSGVDTIYACNGWLYDDGGANANYARNADGTLIILSNSDGNVVSLSGTLVSERTDYMTIYDGVGTSGTILYYGAPETTFNINCTSTSGALTVHFASDGSTEYAGFALHIQCVEVSCLAVQNLRDSVVGASFATIAWNEIGSASQWEIEYGLDGFAHGNGTIAIANATVHTLSNLVPATEYDIYVRGICGVGDTAQWQKLNITTGLCDAPSLAVIGNGTTGNENLPIAPYYGYSYSQQIYTAAEVGILPNGLSTDITSIALQYIAQESTSRVVTIYLGHSTDSVFSSTSDWIPASDLTLVYNGTIQWNNSGTNYWQEIILDSAFAYNGTDNLVVAVLDGTGTYFGSFGTNYFYTHSTVGNKSLVYRTDDNPVNIASPGSGLLGSQRTNICMVTCGINCPVPTAVVVEPAQTSVALSWAVAADYEVAYKETAATAWNTEVSVSNQNSYTFTSLRPETSYDFRLRKLCDSANFSEWLMLSATTLEFPCHEPTSVAASNITYTSATIAWDSASPNPEMWQVTYGYNNDNSTWDTVETSTPSVEINGLYVSTSYNVYVRAYCSIEADVYSEWSEVVTFSTMQCNGVGEVVVSNVSSSSATVQWDVVEGQSKWEITYGPEGFDEGNGTTVVVENTPSYTITGLEADMNYDLYVRNICQDGVYSNWSTKVQFRSAVGINDVEDATAQITVYPNPATSEANIYAQGMSGKVTLVVVDLSGKTILSETHNSETSFTRTLDVSSWAKGTYFLQLNNGTITKTQKLIVK